MRTKRLTALPFPSCSTSPLPRAPMCITAPTLSLQRPPPRSPTTAALIVASNAELSPCGLPSHDPEQRRHPTPATMRSFSTESPYFAKHLSGGAGTTTGMVPMSYSFLTMSQPSRPPSDSLTSIRLPPMCSTVDSSSPVSFYHANCQKLSPPFSVVPLDWFPTTYSSTTTEI
jgi:hypothetical protein